jgi:hypothetical protein
MRTVVLPGSGVLAGLLLAGVPASSMPSLLFLLTGLPILLVMTWEVVLDKVGNHAKIRPCGAVCVQPPADGFSTDSVRSVTDISG